MFCDASNKEIKIYLALKYIDIISGRGEIPEDKSFINSNIINFLSDSIDINSNACNEFYF
jgi:hypothetical protein